MPDLSPILIAGITGLVSGFFLAIPVGPINLTIMNEGAQRGFRWAFLIGLGAAAMETIFCAIAFTGFSSFFDTGVIKIVMEALSVLFLVGLGIRFLFISEINASKAARTGRFEKRIGQRFNPTSAFMTGFIRTMGNVGVLLFWILIAGNLMTRELVRSNFHCKAACVVCIGVGTALWFTTLSRAVSVGHGRFSAKTLLRIEHISGIGLIALGIFNGARIIWQLANHRG